MCQQSCYVVSAKLGIVSHSAGGRHHHQSEAEPTQPPHKWLLKVQELNQKFYCFFCHLSGDLGNVIQ